MLMTAAWKLSIEFYNKFCMTYASLMYPNRGNRRATLEQLAKTAASVSDGDLVGQLIRSHGAWSLLPTQVLLIRQP